MRDQQQQQQQQNKKTKQSKTKQKNAACPLWAIVKKMTVTAIAVRGNNVRDSPSRAT